MLTHPPPPITDGGWVRFPVWPAAKYLARIAADLPDDVLRIIDAAQDTENECVATELARALANMPDEYAAGNVERIASWLEDRATHRLLLPQVAEEYLRRLIARDRPEALAFANALLITRAETRDYGGVESEPSRRWVHAELKPARMDRHHYASLLRHAVPQLAARWPLPTAVLLIEQLQTANAHQAAAIGGNASADASWSSWRRAIEPHPEEFVIDGLRGLLVNAIRDLGQALISEPAAGRELLALLAARHASIFTRLRLHLLRVYGPEHFADLRREAVLDQALPDSAEEWHEYGCCSKTRSRNWARRTATCICLGSRAVGAPITSKRNTSSGRAARSPSSYAPAGWTDSGCNGSVRSSTPCQRRGPNAMKS
ncbi:MAG: hypothetical protein ACLP8S_17520 [Solirubrobacteraceae bacterium]